jgi:shikimate dehydrogenase
MKKQVGLFGYPLGHTKSPAMHNAAYKYLDLNYEYQPYEVLPEKLAEAVQLLRDNKLTGANVTIPYKQTVIQYLDSIDEEAKKIGAINTIVNRFGKLVGYNTDATGFHRALEYYHRFTVDGKKIAIFGEGGVARAMAISSFLKGAKEICIGGLDPERTQRLAREINEFAYSSSDEVFLNEVSKSDLVINATPLGMHPHTDKTPLPDAKYLQPGQLVFDAVYNPKNTVFLQQAKSRGANLGYGYEMLLFQGIVAFEIFTGSKAPLKIMEDVLTSQL